MTDRNPQAEQMAAESMVRTLSAQVRCIWPQERLLLARYGQPKRILDVGCGTGEFTARLAEHYPSAQIVGVELEPEHVERARLRCAAYGDRVRFDVGDAYALSLEDGQFDLVCCRHVLQSIPEPERVVAECHRVLAPQGWVHLLVEDYAMIHVEGPSAWDRFWLDGPAHFGEETGVDARIGRRGISLLRDFSDRRLDFVVVDTERVSRDDFADVITSWRDGYSEVLSQHMGRDVAEVVAIMDGMIEAIRTRYALWQVPIASGRRAS